MWIIGCPNCALAELIGFPLNDRVGAETRQEGRQSTFPALLFWMGTRRETCFEHAKSGARADSQPLAAGSVVIPGTDSLLYNLAAGTAFGPNARALVTLLCHFPGL